MGEARNLKLRGKGKNKTQGTRQYSFCMGQMLTTILSCCMRVPKRRNGAQRKSPWSGGQRGRTPPFWSKNTFNFWTFDGSGTLDICKSKNVTDVCCHIGMRMVTKRHIKTINVLPWGQPGNGARKRHAHDTDIVTQSGARCACVWCRLWSIEPAVQASGRLTDTIVGVRHTHRDRQSAGRPCLRGQRSKSRCKIQRRKPIATRKLTGHDPGEWRRRDLLGNVSTKTEKK